MTTKKQPAQVVDDGTLRVRCSTCNHYAAIMDPGEGAGEVVWKCPHAETNELGGQEACGARNTTEV